VFEALTAGVQVVSRSVYVSVYSVPVSYRPLATVSGLTIGDDLLWNWSLNANHDVLSLVSGLTLPPLVIACVWLLAVTVARLLARTTRGAGRGRSQAPSLRQPARPRPQVADRRAAATSFAERGSAASAPAAGSSRSSRKIAA
jgi:hypothetical protein